MTRQNWRLPWRRFRPHSEQQPKLQSEFRRHHEHQIQRSWQYTEADGTVLGQKIIPMDRVGLYVPGGKAAYPSSVLMNAIPAKVAGVKELVMVVPTPDGETKCTLVLAAAAIMVDRVFRIGGAQALVLRTETIPLSIKLWAPGTSICRNGQARSVWYGGDDMIAGPSEILVICDGKTNPDWITMDLFSQAEHDENVSIYSGKS